MAKDWWHLSPVPGGLGFTRVGVMINSLQLHILCKVILAARAHLYTGIPTWVDPVILLFDNAISPWGRDFDIIYAPISASPDHAFSYKTKRWATLIIYWHYVLHIWNSRLRPNIVRYQSKFDKLYTSFFHIVDIVYRGYGLTLTGQSHRAGLIPILADHAIYRPHDLIRVCKGTVSADTLSFFCAPATHVELPEPSRAPAF